MIILRVLRFVGHKLALLLFSFLIFSSASAWIFFSTAGSETRVLQWLNESNVYQGLPQTLFDLVEYEARNNTASNEVVNKVLDSNAVDIAPLRTVTEQTYDAEFLAGQTESAVTSTYAWLRGETELPEFQISLAGRAQEFVDGVRTELTNQLQTLPGCEDPPTAQNSFNILSATCLPANISIEAEIESYVVELADFTTPTEANDRFLTTAYTGDDLYATAQTNNIDPPAIYSAAQQARIVFPIIALIAAAVIILIARTRSDGLRGVGGTMVSSSLSLFIGAVFLNLSTNAREAFYESQGSGQSQIIANGFLESFLQVVISDVVRSIVVTGSIIFVIGVVVWLGGFIYSRPSRKTKQPTVADLHAAAAHEAPSGVDSASQSAADGAVPAAVPVGGSGQLSETGVLPPAETVVEPATVQTSQKPESSTDRPA